jgi:CubicO group peptidase (beta-lactamase class C family)
MLAYATTAALVATNSPQKDLRALIAERVMKPIGMPEKEWNIGYGANVNVDGLSLVAAWGGGNFTARATARLARLMLREGDWDGKRVLKAEAVRAVTTDPAFLPSASKWLSRQTGSAAIGWWRNLDGVVPEMPRDAFWAGGAGHQIALVIPSLKLIAVRNGDTLDTGSYDDARNKQFFQPLMAALKSK